MRFAISPKPHVSNASSSWHVALGSCGNWKMVPNLPGWHECVSPGTRGFQRWVHSPGLPDLSGKAKLIKNQNQVKHDRREARPEPVAKLQRKPRVPMGPPTSVCLLRFSLQTQRFRNSEGWISWSHRRHMDLESAVLFCSEPPWLCDLVFVSLLFYLLLKNKQASKTLNNTYLCQALFKAFCKE